jgi:signal peptidase I
MKENKIKEFWNWMWKSESILSYLVFLILVFIFIKFIFLPGLSLIFGMGLTGLPLAIVESSSMEHYSLSECTNAENNYCTSYSDYYVLCGKRLDKKEYFNLDEYWQICGNWYESNYNLSLEQFSKFPLKNGFRKGDIMVIWGWKTPEIGDVIVFRTSLKTPIIHRIVSLNPLATKGDHNPTQLTYSNYVLDETNINQEQVIGVAIARIPYLGWPKILLADLIKRIF